MLKTNGIHDLIIPLGSISLLYFIYCFFSIFAAKRSYSAAVLVVPFHQGWGREIDAQMQWWTMTSIRMQWCLVCLHHLCSDHVAPFVMDIKSFRQPFWTDVICNVHILVLLHCENFPGQGWMTITIVYPSHEAKDNQTLKKGVCDCHKVYCKCPWRGDQMSCQLLFICSLF